MRKLRVSSGQKFNRWEVLGEVSKRGTSRYFLCKCDCGTIRQVALCTLSTGKTVSCGCYGKERLKEVEHLIKRKRGTEHQNYKGGHQRKDGYRLVSIDGKLQYEHRVLLESSLGRKLEPSETVHHVNGIKNDNRPSNLEVLSRSEHTLKYHKKKDNIKPYETLFAERQQMEK